MLAALASAHVGVTAWRSRRHGVAVCSRHGISASLVAALLLAVALGGGERSACAPAVGLLALHHGLDRVSDLAPLGSISHAVKPGQLVRAPRARREPHAAARRASLPRASLPLSACSRRAPTTRSLPAGSQLVSSAALYGLVSLALFFSEDAAADLAPFVSRRAGAQRSQLAGAIDSEHAAVGALLARSVARALEGAAGSAAAEAGFGARVREADRKSVV